MLGVTCTYICVMPTSKSWIRSRILLTVNLSIFFFCMSKKSHHSRMPMAASCALFLSCGNSLFLCSHILEKNILPIYHALCLPCMLHCWSYLWLCQRVVLEACKGSTHQVPSIGPATINMKIYTSSETYFWTTQAKHYTVYMCMYNLA